MKDTLIEIKNNVQRSNSRVDEAKNQINDVEQKEVKNIHIEQGEKWSKKNEDSISSIWDNFKSSNIHIIRVPEGKEKE